MYACTRCSCCGTSETAEDGYDQYRATSVDKTTERRATKAGTPNCQDELPYTVLVYTSVARADQEDLANSLHILHLLPSRKMAFEVNVGAMGFLQEKELMEVMELDNVGPS